MTGITSNRQEAHWEVVFSTSSRTEAHIILGRLESEGIQAIMNSEAGRDALGIHIGKLGEIQVLVHESEAERARAILDVVYMEVETDEHDTMPIEGLTDVLIWQEDDTEQDAAPPTSPTIPRKPRFDDKDETIPTRRR